MESIINTERNVFVDKAMRSERWKLLGFIRRRVKTEEDAEDILQDVFYQLISSYSITEPIEKLTSWLFRVARNKIIDWYRKKKSEPINPKSDDDDNPNIWFNIENILYDPAGNPEDIYFNDIIRSELEDALSELPEEQSSVFIMHEVEGMSFKEIAEMTGEPVNTLLSRKRYAVLYLRERLNELYNEINL